MRGAWILGISLSATLVLAHAARAEAVNEDLPKSQILSCGTQCANFTPAKPIKHDLLAFPQNETRGFYATNSEGYVRLLYTVGVDGKTHDISKIYEVGKSAFPERAVETVKNWTFEPALLNGKPVTQTQLFQESFSLLNFSPTRPEILDAYKNATTLFDSGKENEAAVVLQQALAEVRLSLLERSLLALPQARIAMRRKDYLEARRYALMATMPGTKGLSDSLVASMWETLIGADLMLGEAGETLNALSSLQTTHEGRISSYANLVAKARTQWDTAPQLVTQARIPLQGTEGVIYWHRLYRRTFSFAAVVGSLDRYIMTCAQSTTQSKISLTAQWHVPADWSDCTVYVYGAPGTTFRIVETNDDKQQQDQVMAHYDDAIRDDPKNPTRWLSRARAHNQAKRVAEAASDYSKAIELDASLGPAYLERGKINYIMGKIDAAVADSEAALRLDAKDKSARYFHAVVMRDRGRFAEALADLDVLLPDNRPGVYFDHAVNQFALGKYAEAEAGFLKSTSPFSTDLYTYNWIHIARMKRGMEDLPEYAIMRSDLPDTSWIREIASLNRGRQNLEQTQINMKTGRAHPVPQDNWPCSAEFYLGEYKLAHNDIAGAKSDFATVKAARCNQIESAVAAAELQRLP